MEALSGLLSLRLSILNDERGEGVHRCVGVLDRVRKLHLRAPLFGGHLAAHITPRALVEEPGMRVLLEVPLVRLGVGLAKARGNRGAQVPTNSVPTVSEDSSRKSALRSETQEQCKYPVITTGLEGRAPSR